MQKSAKKRGLWDGLPLPYFNDGYSYSDSQMSPDGNFLSYLMSTELGAHLFVKNLTSGEVYQLTSSTPLSTGTAYGGATYCWSSDSSKIILSSKGQLYKVPVQGGIPEKMVSKDKSFSPVVSGDTIVFCVEHEDTMSLATMDENWPEKIMLDADFIYDPVIHPSNGNIAVHAWSFPNMSWNGSKILLLYKNNNWKPKLVAGGDDIATSQPKFSPDGRYLAFNSDKNGWLNLWLANADGTDPRALINAEEENAYSTWVTGDRDFAWTDDSKYIIYTKNVKGFVKLSAVEVSTGYIFELDVEDGSYSHLSMKGNKLSCTYENHNTRAQIRLFTIDFSEAINVQKMEIIASTGIHMSKEVRDCMARPKEVTFPTAGGKESHAHIYALEDDEGNKDNSPVIFMIHGGPTGMSLNKFHVGYQYFVSRGWTVVAVNHRGSIGYGREYRETLNENWGIYDVEDTEAAFNHLKANGMIDAKRSVIMGGSAGGYTTLMVMAMRPDLMTAGVNLFGVADLFMLSEETHFLESQYDTTLVGPLPEAGKKFFERSPVNIADKITRPLIILQGADDPVVLQNQSDAIAKAVKGIVEYKVYEGEGHGFKKRESIKDMYERIEKFLRIHVLYK